jgi:hypothetical protein
MDLKELQKKVIEFRDARDWAQYHNPSMKAWDVHENTNQNISFDCRVF